MEPVGSAFDGGRLPSAGSSCPGPRPHGGSQPRARQQGPAVGPITPACVPTGHLQSGDSPISSNKWATGRHRPDGLVWGWLCRHRRGGSETPLCQRGRRGQGQDGAPVGTAGAMSSATGSPPQPASPSGAPAPFGSDPRPFLSSQRRGKTSWQRPLVPGAPATGTQRTQGLGTRPDTQAPVEKKGLGNARGAALTAARTSTGPRSRPALVSPDAPQKTGFETIFLEG